MPASPKFTESSSRDSREEEPGNPASTPGILLLERENIFRNKLQLEPSFSCVLFFQDIGDLFFRRGEWVRDFDKLKFTLMCVELVTEKDSGGSENISEETYSQAFHQGRLMPS